MGRRKKAVKVPCYLQNWQGPGELALTNEQVDAIRAEYLAGVMSTDLALKYKVSHTIINKVVNKKEGYRNIPDKRMTYDDAIRMFCGDKPFRSPR